MSLVSKGGVSDITMFVPLSPLPPCTIDQPLLLFLFSQLVNR
nr:MAG TPA: hypothetical protein [Caudoviricetes sp.]